MVSLLFVTIFNLNLLGIHFWGFPKWHNGKEFTCQCRRCKRYRFNPRVRKIPWSRKQQPVSVIFPGKFQDRGVWWATVHRVTKNWTWLRGWAHTHTGFHFIISKWRKQNLSQGPWGNWVETFIQGPEYYVCHKENTNICLLNMSLYISKIMVQRAISPLDVCSA